MTLSVESMSDHAKTAMLARLANTLTICARETYEAGTDKVVQPELLRAYNELLHRVTGATRDHLLGNEGYPLEVILAMMREFGERNGRSGGMQWAIQESAKSL